MRTIENDSLTDLLSAVQYHVDALNLYHESGVVIHINTKDNGYYEATITYDSEDKQFCMTCGGEYTEELPCTCTAADEEGDRYMLHGVLARLSSIALHPEDVTDAEAMLKWVDEHDARVLVYAGKLERLTRELIATLTAYLKEDDDTN